MVPCLVLVSGSRLIRAARGMLDLSALYGCLWGFICPYDYRLTQGGSVRCRCSNPAQSADRSRDLPWYHPKAVSWGCIMSKLETFLLLEGMGWLWLNTRQLRTALRFMASLSRGFNACGSFSRYFCSKSG